MTNDKKSITILIAEDESEDQSLLKEALAENQIENNVFFVANGVELLDYLNNRGIYRDPEIYPLPGLILLDLNMPVLDGRVALKEIKSSPHLRRIPIIVLTKSKSKEDVTNAHNLGVSSYISKPLTYTGLIETIKIFSSYWLGLVELP